MAGTSTARARWELENNIQQVEDVDSLFKYDQAEQTAVQQQKPWSKDPHFFKQWVTALVCPILKSFIFLAPQDATMSPCTSLPCDYHTVTL